ncbi:MAG: hypothetical protein MK110_12735 [Fuerstiella sp.]|nr:hypothetical protein [Fuerstiella sp.]
MPAGNTDNIVVLFKGGRLPSWYELSDTDQRKFSQIHVDLMLTVAEKHQLSRLEGFRLIGPQDNWQRFWLIEFPKIKGAERWIRAEMAPPYGRYGYYEYFLSQQLQPDVFNAWGPRPVSATVPLTVDPHNVPELWTDRDSIVVLMFARYRPGAESLSADVRGDAQHGQLMQSIARKYGLIRLEAFQLLTPQNDWHRAWIIELPTLEAAEAWIEGEECLPHGMYAQRKIFLTRKWSPEYFAGWVQTD